MSLFDNLFDNTKDYFTNHFGGFLNPNSWTKNSRGNWTLKASTPKEFLKEAFTYSTPAFLFKNNSSSGNTTLSSSALFNQAEAEKNRLFQESMANSAYQRAVQDMQSAGLNPNLLMNSGAAAYSPTGSMASYGSSGSEDLAQMKQVLGLLTGVLALLK